MNKFLKSGFVALLGLCSVARGAELAPQPRDPLRITDNKLETITRTSKDWCILYGEIVQVHPDGIRIEGAVEKPGQGAEVREFFVANFPYAVAEKEYITREQGIYAKPAGVYSYKTVLGSTRSIRQFDYGEIYKPKPKPLTESEKSAAKANVEKKKSDSDRATFKFHSDQAASGNVGSMYRLGQLYLAGTGCEANTNQAKLWFKKAADAGNADAAAALKSLE